MEIVAATPADIPLIQHIACLTWPLAYAEILTAGQMSYMLNMMYSPANLTRQMTEEGHHFFMIRENGEAFGFAGISPVDYEFKNGGSASNVWKLHKLYVLPQSHKSGAGTTLLEHCKQTIRNNGGDYLVLNVNRDNKAYHFYTKKGFEVIEALDLDIGAGFFMVDYIMGCRL